MENLNGIWLEQSTPIVIDGNKNNLPIAGNNIVLDVTEDDCSITGFAAPYEQIGRCNTFSGIIFNPSKRAVILKNENVDSLEENRIKTISGADYSLPAGSGVSYEYVNKLFRLTVLF